MNTHQVEIAQLKPNPKNPRKISEKELQKLVKSIQEFGFVEPVIVNTFTGRENVVVGGHQRLEAAKRLNMKEVPVVHVNLDPAREELLNLALNRISGEFDETKLADMLADISKSSADLLLSGFNQGEIDKLIAASQHTSADESDIPGYPKVARTQPGEVWQLGRHRLMCGDSTNEKDVKKLMQNDVADASFTDPPYNLAFTGTDKKFEKMKNDELPPLDYASFCQKLIVSLKNHTKATASHYICIDFRNYHKWVSALEDAELDLLNCIVWDKVFAGIGYKYRFRHEFIIFAGDRDKIKWYGDTVQEDFIKLEHNKMPGGELMIMDMKGFSIKLSKGFLRLKMEETLPKRVPVLEGKDITFRTNSNTTTDVAESFSMNYFSQRELEHQEGIVHPTMKPVRMIANFLQNSTKPNDVVVDFCGGSGGTLMACEQTNRNCRIMEIDPGYCDVIIKRWEQATGQEATKA